MLLLPSIIAHRGASADAPENTLEAFREAWAQCADAVECDVRQTRDGAIVLLHDETLLRTAGVDRPIYEMTLAEAQSLDAGGWKGEAWSGQRVPELRDLLRMVPMDKRLTIEIKGGVPMVSALCTELCHAIACGWVTGEQLDVISFDFAALQFFRTVLPEIRTIYLAGYYVDRPNPAVEHLITLSKAAGIRGLSLNFRHLQNREIPAKIRDAELLCCAWTVNETEEMLSLWRAGVDAITTDHPGTMIQALRSEATGKQQ